jgi:hypothetical protein
MKRLAITLEDYQSSKIVRASLLVSNEEPVTNAVLERLDLPFTIEQVQGPLFHYRLDDDKIHVDLQLRTREEISEQIKREPFKEIAESFLNSGSAALRLSLDREDGFLEIKLQER